MEITEVAEFIKSLTEDEQAQLNGLLVGHSTLVTDTTTDPIPPDPTHPR